MGKFVAMQDPKQEAERIHLSDSAEHQQALASVPPVGKQALADLLAAEWNAFNEAHGSFADAHSTL
jgi:hypothetical protein